MRYQLRYFRELDLYIILIVLGLAVFSYIGITGAVPGQDYPQKQLLWYGIGFVVMTAVLLVDYSYVRLVAPALYIAGLLLLAGLRVFGHESKGALSWYKLPGGIQFQPSELMKIFLILMLAWYFSLREEQGKGLERFSDLLVPFLILAVPLVLILQEPDLGTSLVLIWSAGFMLISAKIRWQHVLILFLVLAIIVAALVGLYLWDREAFFKVIKPHQWNRLISFINPDAVPADLRYQVEQSLIAVGSGQLLGKGLFQGTQGRYQWVPEVHSDFIFTVIAEEHGFVGASLLLLLFFLLLYRMFQIAADAKDTFGVYVIMGIVGMWIFHILENIGMTIQLMPITGIPLPFISYGGSSLLSNFVALGLVLNIGMRRKKIMFKN
jgi:rod shape determining protein RodA